MFKADWKKLLEAAWIEKLETTLDLSQAKRVHLIAQEAGKGEINRFLSIGDAETDRRLVVKRVIEDLAELKLADHDPQMTNITALKWVR